jgi:hypothetical protein
MAVMSGVVVAVFVQNSQPRTSFTYWFTWATIVVGQSVEYNSLTPWNRVTLDH